MRLVYIAGPITKGDLAHNINQGTEAFVALARAGIAPMCPQWSAFSGKAFHAAPGVVMSVAGATPNELSHGNWLDIDLAWIDKCDAVLRLPGESIGADREVAHAMARDIPVFDSIDDLLAYFGVGR